MQKDSARNLCFKSELCPIKSSTITFLWKNISGSDPVQNNSKLPQTLQKNDSVLRSLNFFSIFAGIFLYFRSISYTIDLIAKATA